MSSREWGEFETHVMDKLDTLQESITELKVDVSDLKVKAGIWGAIAGLVPVAIALILQEIYKK